MSVGVRLLAAVCLTVAAAGCTILPKDGPSAAQITTPSDAERQYVIVDLSHAVVSSLAPYRAAPFSSRFAGRPAPAQTVGVGDQISVTLFEAGQGGLFSSEGGARVSPELTSDSRGYVSIPYAGRIRAAGRTPSEIEAAIVAALEGKAIQPQALVTIRVPVSNTIVVSGDVAKPGRYPITPIGDRLLDAIALAGGSSSQPFETQVRMVRNGVTGSVLLKQILDNPADNVYVLPGDTLYLIRDPLTFTVFGSVAKPGEIRFETEDTTLLEALAKTGGLNNATADAKGVFLFRYEPAAVVRSIVPDYDGRFGATVPVVYRLNMEDPNAFFYAKGIQVRDDDVLYIATAPGRQFMKFLQLLNGVTGAGRNVAQTVNYIDR